MKEKGLQVFLLLLIEEDNPNKAEKMHKDVFNFAFSNYMEWKLELMRCHNLRYKMTEQNIPLIDM